MSALLLSLSKFSVYILSQGETVFFYRTNTARCEGREREREREHGFVFFFFMWWEGLWDKGCDAMPVEFSLDQSCSPVAAQWRTQMHVCFHAGDVYSGRSSCKISSTRTSVGVPGRRWVCHSLGWLEIRRKKQKTGIWLKSPEGERMERERWNGSVASKKDINISRLCFSFFCCCRGWICVEPGTAAEQNG